MIKYDYTVTVTGNTAKLDKDIYLFRGNKNVHYYFAIKNASFNFKGTTDLIEKTNAINAAVTVVKPNAVEVANAIAEVENGKIHLKVTEDLIDEEVEVGDFDLVFDLFDDTDGAVTIPKVTGQFHVLERPCTTPISELAATNTTNEVDLAVADCAIATYAEPVASTNADGTFAKKTWVAKEKITTAELNRMEDGIGYNNTQIKNIKSTQIVLEKDDTSMTGIDDTTHDTLTTTNKTIIGGINEVNSQCKDITNKVSTQVDDIIKNKFSNKKTVVTSSNLLNTTQFENKKMSDLLSTYNSGELLIDVIPDAFVVGQSYNTEVVFTDETVYAGGDFFFQFLKDSTVLFSRYTFNLTDLPNKAKLVFNKEKMLNSYGDKTLKYIQVCKKASGETYPKYSQYTEDTLFDEFITKSDINKLSLENISPFLLPSKSRIIGHKGGSSYPENSLLNFEEGCKLGYDFIETDIWQTSDGELVCMHDQDVSRTTDGTGDIMKMTLEQVKSLNIDTDSNYTDLKIPTIKEYLLVCKKYGKIPVIEIKNINQDWDKLASSLTDCNMQNSAIVLSTSINFLKQIREKLPQVHCSYLIYNTASITTSILEELQKMKNTSIDTNIELTEEIVKQCHAYNVLVGMWTIDNIDKANTLIKYGVDFITTNTSKLINTNTSDTLLTTNISGTTLSLTTNKYQTATIKDGTEITLPTVTSFTEIHLFFNTTTDLTLTLPACKWQNGSIPTISANKTYEFIFTYTTEWLGGVIEYVA